MREINKRNNSVIRTACLVVLCLGLALSMSCKRKMCMVEFNYNGGMDDKGNICLNVVIDGASFASAVPVGVKLPTVPERSVAAWTTVLNDESTAIDIDTFTPQPGSLTMLYAYYTGGESNYAMVTFVTSDADHNATEVASMKVLKGTRLNYTPIPTISGWEFVSWSTARTPQYKASISQLTDLVDLNKFEITQNQTLTAAFRPTTTTITYCVGQWGPRISGTPDTVLTESSTPFALTIPRGKTITSEELPQLSSSTKYLPFLGWSTRTYSGESDNSITWHGFGDPAYLVKPGEKFGDVEGVVLYASFGPEMVNVPEINVPSGRKWTISRYSDETLMLADGTSVMPSAAGTIGKTEVPLGLWKFVMENKAFSDKGDFLKKVTSTVHSTGNARVFVGEPNSMAPGSHFTGGGLDGPVNNISWCEAVVFCNELTRMLFGQKPIVPSATPSVCAYRLSDRSGNPTWTESTVNGRRYAFNTSDEWEPCNSATELRQPIPAGSQSGTESSWGFRLPFEAEWESASRGGYSDNTSVWNLTFPGSSRINDVAVWGNGESGTTTEGGVNTRAVATLKPNSLGIFDMCGNVAEYTTNSSFSSTVPMRRVRGGSCITPSQEGAIMRDASDITHDRSVGFRLYKAIRL